ncbi:hypothetical protein RRG08_023047 [Elysia crispata]|uniref:Uncharacterized protein n=1 Tax=Elysia crispata TaxID=231223 RepID=A0AAE1E4Q5_9GAST|nr:hypothetical protein RRG08_023047 [Elysia crispata]
MVRSFPPIVDNFCYGQIISPHCGQLLLWSDHFSPLWTTLAMLISPPVDNSCYGQLIPHTVVNSSYGQIISPHCGQFLLCQAHGFIDPLKKILVGASLTLLHLTSLDKPCFSYSPDTFSLTLGSQETRLQKPPAIFQETCGSAIVAIAADSS